MAEGTCEICGNRGEVHRHHIIGRHAIKKIKKGQHGHNLDLMNRPQNLITLCVPCHELTDSHILWKVNSKLERRLSWFEQIKRLMDANRKPGETANQQHRRMFPKRKCKACNSRQRVIPINGYCSKHAHLAEED
jgi:hypothetical protein